MKKLIDALPIRGNNPKIFRETFRLYNNIYSRKIELSEDDLNRIYKRIHAKALKLYKRKSWASLEANDEKFWYSENPDKKVYFPLVPVLINYGNAILKDSFLEISYPDNPEKATVEFILVFIYAYVNSMKSKENITTHLPPELLSSAIDSVINHLVAHKKYLRTFNSLIVNLIFEILRLNNCLYHAERLEKLYNKPALNKIWEGKIDDTIVGGIMLDGDEFKKVNDNCGHPVGDEVLEIYMDSILSAIELSIKPKTRAFPARFGGEEFFVCVFDSNEDEIINLSKKIESELKSHVKWEELKKRQYKEQIVFPRTFSQGIALGKKSDFEYFIDLEKKADEQMYKAKKEGNRNCIYYNDRRVSD